MAEDKWVYHLRSFGVGSELMKESTRDAIIKRQRSKTSDLAYTQWKKEGRFDRRVDPTKWINPPGKSKLPIEERGVLGEHMAQKAKQKQQLKEKQNQKYQTTGKQSLLTNQKGGGKSGGGGGGKWGWNRLFRRGGSPWNLLKSDKNF